MDIFLPLVADFLFKFCFSGDVPVPAVRELNQLLHASQHLSHARQDQEFLRQAQNISRRGEQNIIKHNG
jgi:hypothetical protein